MATQFNKLASRCHDLLMSSVRPTQLMLASGAMIIAIKMAYEYFIAHPTGSDLMIMATYINVYLLIAAFASYATATFYCGFTLEKNQTTRVVRYVSSIGGVLLWSLSLAAVMVTELTGTNILHIGPVVAEIWILSQLVSKVRETDRRAL